jgi:GTPase SAR1 family protein
MTESFFNGSKGIILVFDLSNLESFFRLNNWMTSIFEHKANDAVCIMLGNKSDSVEKHVDQHEIDAFIKKYQVRYFETSAKLNKGIDEAFHFFTGDIAAKFFPESLRIESKTVR